MDSDQFDQITTRLATGLTRRRTLGLLSVLGVAVAVLAEDAAAGKKKRKKHRNRKKPKPPTPPTGACVTNADCPGSCTCVTPTAGGAKVCASSEGTLAAAGLCETCPEGTVTCTVTNLNAFCFAACGASTG